jgi:hypothetical protein
MNADSKVLLLFKRSKKLLFIIYGLLLVGCLPKEIAQNKALEGKILMFIKIKML